MDAELPESIEQEQTDVNAASSAAHWTESIGSAETCPNCNAAFQGAFCSECGQRRLTTRLRFVDLAKTVVSQLVNVERGLFRTFLDMMRRPGEVARDYVSGKQRPYVNPLTYFFVGAAAQLISFFLCLPIIRKNLRVEFEKVMTQNAELATALEKVFSGEPVTAIIECYTAAIQQAYTYAALLFFCVPFSLFLLMLHRVAGEKFRLAETFVFALYSFAQMLIITAVTNLIALRIDPMLQSVLALGTYAVYPQWAHGGFFQRTWLSRLMTLIATFLTSCIFFSSIMFIFVATVVAAIVWNA